MVTKEEIRKLIIKSLKLLIEKDRDLLCSNNEYRPKNKQQERRLYEICVNHRLAFYIETLLIEYSLDYYKVDIEYNLNYSENKRILINGTAQDVRPDIIIHRRMNKDINPQHLLIIEAKKNKNSKRDKDKIEQFMARPFEYKYGLFVK